MGSAKPLTQKQLAAIYGLKRALDRCAREGVALLGMDDAIYAYRADDMDRLHNDEGLDHHDAGRALHDHSEAIFSSAYRDSGGW